VDELHNGYGVPRRLGRTWIESEQVIPLLDGLDEVAPEHRDACIAAINQFHQAHGLLPLAVCCRLAEYEARRAKLQLRGALMIQPLTQADIEFYLQQAGEPLAGVREVLREDRQLSELLTTPLFLSIVALAYKGRPASAVRVSDGSFRYRFRGALIPTPWSQNGRALTNPLRLVESRMR
jgi:predicted NACHT family NTPase